MCILVRMFGADTFVYVNGVQNGLGLGCWTCWPARQVAHMAGVSALRDKRRLNRLLVRWDERDIGFVRDVGQKKKEAATEALLGFGIRGEICVDYKRHRVNSSMQ